MNDLMLDIETLGTTNNAVITQIGACYFNRLTGEVGEKFLININVESSLREGFEVSAHTLEWWMTEQQDNITFFEDPCDVKAALLRFNGFASKANTIWCHATFDMPIILNALEKFSIKPNFHYTTTRDIRTLSDLAGSQRVQTKGRKTHNALDDCLFQVEYCTAYMKKVMERLDEQIGGAVEKLGDS